MCDWAEGRGGNAGDTQVKRGLFVLKEEIECLGDLHFGGGGVRA